MPDVVCQRGRAECQRSGRSHQGCAAFLLIEKTRGDGRRPLIDAVWDDVVHGDAHVQCGAPVGNTIHVLRLVIIMFHRAGRWLGNLLELRLDPPWSPPSRRFGGQGCTSTAYGIARHVGTPGSASYAAPIVAIRVARLIVQMPLPHSPPSSSRRRILSSRSSCMAVA